ncbi:metallophosphoesterase family protein [Gemmata sp.]|uniref:metallophosphoesterase family protein n=1 Tax=Gemmata sp. TaxID=1914242 RepID=UPI003F71FB81
MRIGVVSDTHDRQEAVAEAVRLLTEQHVELILHCGDIESPDTIRAFRPVPTHFVFGNWDKDKVRLAAAIKEIGGTHYESFGALELGGKRIAWVHSHERHQLRQLENADFFDYVFYGHTHVREQHRTGKTVVANPGALFRANPKTCIVLDVHTGEIKPIIVPVAPRASVNGAAHTHPPVAEGVGSVVTQALPVAAELPPPPVDPPAPPG